MLPTHAADPAAPLTIPVTLGVNGREHKLTLDSRVTPQRFNAFKVELCRRAIVRALTTVVAMP